MNKIMLIVISLLLIGCSNTGPGEDNAVPKIACIDGVKYVYYKGMRGNHGFGYMSVKFNREGKVELCDTYLPLPPQ